MLTLNTPHPLLVDLPVEHILAGAEYSKYHRNLGVSRIHESVTSSPFRTANRTHAIQRVRPLLPSYRFGGVFRLIGIVELKVEDSHGQMLYVPPIEGMSQSEHLV